MAAKATDESTAADVDVLVVGAGMAGLYLIHRSRQLGLTARAIETGGGVGGTWFWNRYPGARCDVQSIDYSYSFDPELEADWTWSEKYATQPEILAYLNHVADRYDLRPAISFNTRLDSAVWDDETSTWTSTVSTDDGQDTITSRHVVMATGCLSAPKSIDVDGLDRFGGDVYYTSRWPHDGVDFTGKRVAVIGTGSSGIQSIPLIAAQADHLTVYQRTPNFSIPAGNGAPAATKIEDWAADPAGYRERARWSRVGVPGEVSTDLTMQVPVEERLRRFEEAWAAGTITDFGSYFADLLGDPEANNALSEFVRNKIRDKVDDPEVAEKLCPDSFPIMTKRLCLDTNYYETYNRDNVDLIDLREDPIVSITENGIATENSTVEVDAIVFATGFDAMTGAIVAVDITGRGGRTLAQRWADGPLTYLGLMSEGFPNLFMITGPQSPSVLSNMAVSIEQHVEWVTDAIANLAEDGHLTIEPTATAEAGWVQYNNDFADITLFPQANSWYMGANVPGKPRVFLPYVGGVDRYRAICDEVTDRDYLGFARNGPDGEVTVDGVIRRLMPDVTLMLEAMEELDLPPIESMSPPEARAFMDAINAERPPGPGVGEMIDGTFPGADGELAYRLYRPTTEGPHPLVVYYHGGGWVLGDQLSDEPFCREMCQRADVVVLSVDYRHGPESRFPAAFDDAWAALLWAADNVDALGGVPGRLAVSGWSAGANLAAVVAQRARNNDGPDLSAQLLVTPVTDHDFDRLSYRENADGYVLTAPLMKWFWDHYADEADRDDPRASPLRAKDLSGLPPAVVVTSEFDPLRDEGIAYAEALADAGVSVDHQPARGHTHTSLHQVDVLPSSAQPRRDMFDALKGLLGVPARV